MGREAGGRKMKKDRSAPDLGKAAKGILAGVLTAAVMIFVLCLIAAFALSREWLPESAAGYIGYGICAVGAWVGCARAQRSSALGRLPASLCCGAVLLACMWAVHLLCRAEGEAVWYSAGIVLACALVSAILGAGKRRG